MSKFILSCLIYLYSIWEKCIVFVSFIVWIVVWSCLWIFWFLTYIEIDFDHFIPNCSLIFQFGLFYNYSFGFVLLFDFIGLFWFSYCPLDIWLWFLFICICMHLFLSGWFILVSPIFLSSLLIRQFCLLCEGNPQ